MSLDPELCYQAFRSRDRRFEGRFVAAVTSTGIYCRPGCPARLPRRAHLRFYACAAAAESAGFRPCLRCRPDAAPGAPPPPGTAATVRRALRLIAEGGLDGMGLEALAARLGVTSRHLRRLFHQHLGASPQAVAQTHRAHFARRLVEETALPMTQVALGAGFSSLRRFNDAFRKAFRRPPSAFRAERPAPAARRGIELRIPTREPFDWAGTLAFLRARAVPGVESVDDSAYRRGFRLEGGHGDGAGVRGALEVTRAPGERALRVRLSVPEPRELLAVVGRVARLFDVETDARAIATHLGRDPLLAPALRRAPGLRVPGAWDPFELMVRAMLGQQVTVAGARTLAGRLAEAHGEALSVPGYPGLNRLFPTPAALARADLTRVGLPAARARALRALAARVADGSLRLEALGNLESAVKRLSALPGVGEWTAQYVAMRALGEPDAFPAGDLGIRRALGRAGRAPTPREIRERAERWRPWRAYAAMALWRQPLTVRSKETQS
ncbi:MAG TPA: AlkA N-terminal domain-containing protein [Candidatus Saccharimonadales bacterium]|nr:AlkA N-terminal domain-containing protein [Candidatus Saccharimonadales bacterium]